MNAPTPVIILVPFDAGSPKEARRAKPSYPTKPKQQPWPLCQPIPKFTPDPAQIAALKRQGREVLEATRHQARHLTT